ncbi:MAG: hypothetical protein Q8P20_06705 [bacterium]|nr:hypothetical protein [bacterium]
MNENKEGNNHIDSTQIDGTSKKADELLGKIGDVRKQVETVKADKHANVNKRADQTEQINPQLKELNEKREGLKSNMDYYKEHEEMLDEKAKQLMEDTRKAIELVDTHMAELNKLANDLTSDPAVAEEILGRAQDEHDAIKDEEAEKEQRHKTDKENFEKYQNILKEVEQWLETEKADFENKVGECEKNIKSVQEEIGPMKEEIDKLKSAIFGKDKKREQANQIEKQIKEMKSKLNTENAGIRNTALKFINKQDREQINDHYPSLTQVHEVLIDQNSEFRDKIDDDKGRIKKLIEEFNTKSSEKHNKLNDQIENI